MTLNEREAFELVTESATGRLIVEGSLSISAIALSASRPFLSLSGSLRKVVPERLSSVSQPTFFSQQSRAQPGGRVEGGLD